MAVALHDPGGVILRRAARTAVVMPLVFAVGIVILDRKDMAIFASFGSFAMLGLADFGGPPRARIAAYLGATILGGALVAIATPVSGDPWLGAAMMAVVGAVLIFGGVLGGYASAGAGALTLAFVLAVTIPASVDEIPIRVAGWALAGLASAVAAVVLWPAHETDAIRRQATLGFRATADLLEALTDPSVDRATVEQLRQRSADAATALDQTTRDIPNRPVGPTPRVQALAYLVNEMRGLSGLVDDLVTDTGHRRSSIDQELLGDTADLLGALANGDTPDLVEFEASFETNRVRTSDALVAAVQSRTDGADLAVDLEQAFRVRTVAGAALSVGANSVLATGATLPDTTWLNPPIVPPLALTGSTRRYAELARAQLRTDSVWFRNGVRAGVGLGLAVLIAGLASLSHAFWVALATLSVLKSNAVGTRHTAAQAFIGTFVGFLLASALAAAVGTNRIALWLALPICVFLAVYTPTAVRFVVGQGMFTILVVVLFNLVQPEGWRVAAARVEDITVGAATAFVVGVLLWPRGAGTALRSSLSDLFATGGEYLGRAIDLVLARAPTSDIALANLAAHAAALQTNDAFTTFLDERGPKTVPAGAWASMITVGETLPNAGDALAMLAASRGPVVGYPREADRLAVVAGHVEDALQEVAASIAERRATARDVFDHARRVELNAIAGDVLASLTPNDTPDRIEGALRLAWTVDRIASTQRALAELEEPLAEAAVARRRWWR